MGRKQNKFGRKLFKTGSILIKIVYLEWKNEKACGG